VPEDGPADSPLLATESPIPPPLPEASSSVPPPAPVRRHRGRWALAVAASALVALAIGLGIGLGTSGTGGVVNDPRAASSLLRSVLRAANAAGGFHYESSSTQSSTSSSLTQVTVGDAGASSGRQAITIGNSHFTVLVVGQTAYFDGDAVATSATLGLPATTATRYAGRWISLVPGDSPYQSVYAAVTTSSALHDNITFSPRREVSGTKYDGKDVIALSGPLTPIEGQPAKGTATLYVTAARPHLPVGYVEKGTVGAGSTRSTLAFTIHFSTWGVQVPVTAPSGAVAFASVAPPAGGSSGAPGPPGPTFIT
jgi:hypothetical protein